MMSVMLKNAIENLSPYLSSWIDYQLWAKRLPGLQVCIRLDGEILYSKGHGVADLETGAPLTSDHVLHVASHSKTFTTTLAMMFVERGELRLDAPVGTYVPEVKDIFAGQVTMRELLSHTAGIIRDGVDSDHWDLTQDFPDEAHLLEILRGCGKHHERHEFFHYSNIGYGLAGLVLERISGRSFDELARELILTPLCLEKTFPDYTEGMAVDVAGAYGRPRGADYARRHFKEAGTGALDAATGFMSTAEDITAFIASLVPGDKGLLSDDSRREMLRVHGTVEAGGGHLEYGMGTFSQEIKGRRFYGHTGGWPGALSRTGVDLEDKLAISIIGMSLDTPLGLLFNGIVELIGLATAKQASTKKAPEGIDLSTFTGRFESEWDVIDVVEFGGQLVALSPLAGVGEPEDLTVVDESTLRTKKKNSMAGHGEDIAYATNDEGTRFLRVVGESQTQTATW